MTDTTRSIMCPYCPRLFGSVTALTQHVNTKRRVSAAHGLEEMFPKSRQLIADAIEQASSEPRPIAAVIAPIVERCGAGNERTET